MSKKYATIGAPCDTPGGSYSIDIQNLLETRLLIQANSGGGKSWALRKILETAYPFVQQIVIDPEGEFQTLREKFDYLVCAPHDADAVATPQTAALLGRRLLEVGVSAILDIYDLKAHERTLFVKRFLDALINAPRALWKPVLVVIDECHVYAPQVGEAESRGAVIDLATRGRKRGLCLIAATQRLSKLHKDVAAELLNKLIGRTGLDIDVKRAADELGMSAADATRKLRNLSPGYFFGFGPSLQNGVVEIRIGKVETEHPKTGQRMMQAPPPASDAIRKSLAKLADLQTEAEQEAADLEALRKENAQLKRELTKAGKGQGEAISKAAAEKARRAAITETIRRTRAGLKQREQQAATYLDAAHAQIGLLYEDFIAIEDAMHGDAAPTLQEPARAHPAATESKPRPKTENGASVYLPTGERATLIACAQHEPFGCTREQLSILTGYKRSTRDAYIQRLRERGYVTPQDDRIMATRWGADALGDFERLPEGDALAEYWLGRLPEGESKVLREVLTYAEAGGVARDFLGERCGFKRSTRDAYIQRLRQRQLIRIDNAGNIVASEHLRG